MLLVLLVQLLNHVRLPVTPWTVAHQAFLFITNSWSLLKLMSIELVIPFSRLILCCPLLLLLSIFPSIRVFSNELAIHIRWPKYWEFQLQHQSFQYSLGLTGLIFLQSKGLSRVFSSITIQKNQFYSAQPSLWSNSHIHTCWKNHSFEYMDFVGKVMSFFLICWLGLW